MKNSARVSVLAGLLLAPAAIASANEVETPADGEQLEPVVAGEVSTGAVPYNVVAEIKVDKERIEELFKLDGKTTISNFATYEQMVDEFFPAGTYEPENKLLKAKLTFLKGLQDLNARATSLSNEIGLLKTTHPNLFDTVPNLVKERGEIAQKFKDIRQALDDVYLNNGNYPTEDADAEYPFITDFDTQAMQAVDNYLMTVQDFEAAFIKNAKVLETFAQDIIKAKAFVYGGEIATTNPGAESGTEHATTPDTISVEPFVEEIKEKDVLADETEAEEFKGLLNRANQFYSEKMTANEKKIADSHVLDDERTVSVVMKQANDDLTKANKVTELITGIQSVTGKDYKSKVGKVVSEYEKLNVRSKMLVLDYDEKVAPESPTDGPKAGYKDGLDFIEQVDALKPNATPDYRESLEEAEKTYGKLTTNLQDLLVSYNDRLVDYRKDVTAAKAVEDLIEGLTINKNVTSEDIENAKKAYNALTSSQKKIVDNYKELQGWEKSGKSTIKLSDQIDAIAIENKKTFATKVDALNKTYKALTDGEKSLVKSYDRLEYLTPFAAATGKFYSLKPTAETYKTDVLELHATLTATTGDLANILVDSGTRAEDKTELQKLKEALTDEVIKRKDQLDKADPVIEAIEAAEDETNPVKQLLAIQAARAAYTGLPKEEQKLVTNLKLLTDLEKMVKQPAAVTKSIGEVDPEAKTFASKAKSAVTAFEKLTASQKSFISPEYQNRVEDFKTYLKFVDQVKALKSSDPGFQEAYMAAQKQYDELIKTGTWKNGNAEYTDKIIKVIETYKPILEDLKQAIGEGNGLVQAIENLGLLVGRAFLDEAERIETAYSNLSADGKKQVKNYKKFQEMKKDGTAALKVVDLINDPIINNRDVANRNYAKKVDSALKAYEKLSSRQKLYVYNYTSGLQPYLKIYEVVEAVNNLKPTAKTYMEDVAAVRAMYDRLTTIEKNILAPLLNKIEGAETGLVTVNEVMDMIEEARPGVEGYVQKLVAAREAYDKLARINSSYQKLVLNYKTLQEREKALKPVTTSIHQIIELEEMLARPFNQASDFVKKYNTAVKAYESIPYESRALVYNRDVLLSRISPVAKTMEAIQNIKQTSKTFGEDVAKARFLYDALSAADKVLVTNYRDLQAFEDTVSGGSTVDDLIRQIPRTGPSGYMQAIKDARSAYDMLMPAEKKAVTLYKELQNYEKGVKNVQAAIDAIDNVQFASNLVSAYDKATKALDKLTAEQRQMVPNLSKLQSVGPAIEVYKLIASLKPSSANYAGSVQAAYAAYNMLSSAEKQYVTNFAALQEAKNNVDIVQAVISKIAGLSSSAGNYAKQVEEAMVLYNSLPSSVRKLVTNYDVLKAAEKEAGAVDKVRAMISEINPNVGNFSSKVKAARSAYDKLSTQQKRLVTNYFLLEDYETQIDGSTLFF